MEATKNKKPTKAHQAKMEKIAVELRKYLLEHSMWTDTRIYFNGKAFCSIPDDASFAGGYSYYNNPERLKVIEDISPKTYMDYCNPDTVTVSFEGPLYEELNYGTYGWQTSEDLRAMFAKYGYYSELGNAWNFTLFEK